MQPDRDLDRELRDLGPRVEYPPVPDLARSVRGRLETEAGGAGSPPRARPQLWWIAAAALVLLVAVPVASLAIRGTSAGGGAAGGAAVESGGQEAGDAGSTRLTEEAAAGPTHSAGDDGSLAVGAGGGSSSSSAAHSGASAASAEAACAYPETSLEARPQRGAPGDGFGIRGRYFESDVWDCDLDPARSVRITFSQGGRKWKLGSFEVSEGSRLSAKLEVPADARPGRATLRATYEQISREDLRGETSVEARFFVTG